MKDIWRSPVTVQFGSYEAVLDLSNDGVNHLFRELLSYQEDMHKLDLLDLGIHDTQAGIIQTTALSEG